MLLSRLNDYDGRLIGKYRTRAGGECRAECYFDTPCWVYLIPGSSDDMTKPLSRNYVYYI